MNVVQFLFPMSRNADSLRPKVDDPFRSIPEGREVGWKVLTAILGVDHCYHLIDGMLSLANVAAADVSRCYIVAFDKKDFV